tara:strand:+ start:82 stop:531 length:450 start_codon:yes stop_codon:yes gene_type:complete
MSNKNIFEFLEKYFSEHRNYAAGPVPNTEIEMSEQKLQVKFSESYKKFLSLYGGALLEESSIYGLRKEEMMGDDNWSVTQLTLYYRNQKYPGTENWYIVSDDFSGNPFGVDPDGKVWLSDHDTGEIIQVAETFEDFLYKLYTDTLWEDD